jgi:hypothetical protein
MAVKYLAGNRLWGTDAERLALTTGTDSLGSSADGANGSGTAITIATMSGLTQPTGLATTDCFNQTVSSQTGRIKITETTSVLPAGTGDWTVAYWFNISSIDQGHNQEVVRHADDFEVNIKDESSGDSTHKYFGGSGNLEHTVTSGKWYWGCLVNDSGTVNFYQDNVASGDGTTTPYATIVASTNNDTSWNIMGRSNESEGFVGQTKDIAFWDRAITSVERGNIYASGAGASPKDVAISDLRAYYEGNSIAPNSASIYPNLPNGATFLTSDTNKLYMFDGTDTWNEVG